jgi:hypothetical protein
MCNHCFGTYNGPRTKPQGQSQVDWSRCFDLQGVVAAAAFLLVAMTSAALLAAKLPTAVKRPTIVQATRTSIAESFHFIVLKFSELFMRQGTIYTAMT